MKLRLLLGLAAAALAGCQNGPSTVPPPGTAIPGNSYYQPPAGSAFTAPTYGSAAATNPNLSPRGVNLAANSTSDGLPWQPVTKQPVIGRSASTIQPTTTLTSIRGTGNPVAASPAPAVRSGNELPMIPIPSAAAYPPATAPAYPPPAPLLPPSFTAPFFAPSPPVATRPHSDPWRGR